VVKSTSLSLFDTVLVQPRLYSPRADLAPGGFTFPTLFILFPAVPPGHPPVTMGAHLLFEQRRLALFGYTLVVCNSPAPIFWSWELSSIFYRGKPCLV